MNRNPEIDDDTDQALERVFDAARAVENPAPDRLMLAILQDAQRVQPTPMSKPEPVRRGWFDGFNLGAVFAQWPAAAVLAACLGAGVFIGYAAPEEISPFTDSLTGAQASSGLDTDTYFSLDGLLSEG